MDTGWWDEDKVESSLVKPNQFAQYRFYLAGLLNYFRDSFDIYENIIINTFFMENGPNEQVDLLMLSGLEKTSLAFKVGKSHIKEKNNMQLGILIFQS